MRGIYYCRVGATGGAAGGTGGGRAGRRGMHMRRHNRWVVAMAWYRMRALLALAALLGVPVVMALLAG